MLILGCVCEVVAGEVRSIRTFESLQDDDLPPLAGLEPGYQHAFELLRVVRKLIAPVAWGSLRISKLGMSGFLPKIMMELVLIKESCWLSWLNRVGAF